MSTDIPCGPLSQADIDLLFIEAQTQEVDNPTYAKKLYERNVPGAARSIINLALASPNDAIRFKAAVYVTERALGRIPDGKVSTSDPDDPWSKLAAECIGEMTVEEFDAVRGLGKSE